MNIHKDGGESLEPCKHMESMLNRTADGTASPLVRWYAKWHAKGCSRCGRFLNRVTELLSKLKVLKNADAGTDMDRISPERWETIEANLIEAEKQPS